jgi:7,8-didemethyl-8-hydroxy-5-deazariboflavin synthase CofG subunit
MRRAAAVSLTGIFRGVSPLTSHDGERIVLGAVENGRLEAELAHLLGDRMADPDTRRVVVEGAAESKRLACGDVVTVSRNVFIPLTNLCRDRCAYCTFAKQPPSPEARTYTLAEVADTVGGGVATGCVEALFCLGDKPEIAHQAYREWLGERGYRSTVEYLVEACRVALEGGLLPHTNAGVLSQEEMAQLRPWNASMGLMLETTSPRLRGRGMAHQHAPDKDPAARIRMHEEAGELRIPFTSGMLLGIGENAAERVDTLLAIRRLHDRHGHIQEAIIQPFHPKPGTRMRAACGLRDEEVAGWAALARLVLGREIQVQVPPNLTPGVLELLLRSGVSDWGGVSPVSADFVNPEAPWPTLRELRERTASAGQRLVERLPVHAAYLARPEFLDPKVREAALRLADDDGHAGPRQEAA